MENLLHLIQGEMASVPLLAEAHAIRSPIGLIMINSRKAGILWKKSYSIHGGNPFLHIYYWRPSSLQMIHVMLLKGTSVLLVRYMRGRDAPENEWTPRTWFVVQQSTLTAKELRRRLVKRQLTFFDIREDISNLFSLSICISQLENTAYIVISIT